MKILKIIIALFLFIIVAASVAWFGFLKPEPPAISEEDRSQIMIMPLPAELKLKQGLLLISPDFGHTINRNKSERMEKIINRFYDQLHKHTQLKINPKKGKTLEISFEKKGNLYPTIEDDESYYLKVNKTKIELNSRSEKGIQYGLESVLQLLKEKNGNWYLPSIEITDSPRYPWRGLMIDVSRHWIPKEVILRNLDAMAALKMNVFHCHLSDYQGFRVGSKVFPKLHEMGSQGNYYTQMEIKEIVSYAADRGIRVVPEFDVPGHATSWLVGYPELASATGPYELETTFGISTPVLDPSKPYIYDFLDQFIEEMKNLFPDAYFHIGGDEVNENDWNKNKSIQKFMQENGIADASELQAYFNIRLQKIVSKHGKIMMGWDEILHPKLPKDSILIQSWRNHKSLWKAARNGNQALLSAGFYLDHKQSAAFHYKTDPLIIPNAVTIAVDTENWKSWDNHLYFNENDIESQLYLFGKDENLRGIVNFMDTPTEFTDAVMNGSLLTFSIESSFGTIVFELELKENSIDGFAKLGLFTLEVKGTKSGGSTMTSGKPLPKFDKIIPLREEQELNLLGGEACMWTEMADATTIESRIWPRAAVIAEKLWTPQALTKDTEDLYRRLMWIDTFLANRGIKHLESSNTLIKKQVGETFQAPLKTLVSVLQEDILFNRMEIYTPQMYTTTPLNRVVDAARPESYIAYRFNKDVDSWLKNQDPNAKENIILFLTAWSENHDKLNDAFKSSEYLKEVLPHSKHLSKLSELALIQLNNKSITKKMPLELIEDAKKPYGGTVLAVSPGLIKLVYEE